jgi:hypothetical protein
VDERGFEAPAFPVFTGTLSRAFSQRVETKYFGGREGIRTPGLLVANEATNLIRRGAATT